MIFREPNENTFSCPHFLNQWPWREAENISWKHPDVLHGPVKNMMLSEHSQIHLCAALSDLSCAHTCFVSLVQIKSENNSLLKDNLMFRLLRLTCNWQLFVSPLSSTHRVKLEDWQQINLQINNHSSIFAHLYYKWHIVHILANHLMFIANG